MIPILHLPGEMIPGQFGPISLVFLPFRNALARIMSKVGIPSVMQTTSSMPAAVDSMMASAANGGGTNMTEAFAPGFFDRIENIDAFVLRTAFARRHAADDLGSIFDRLKRVEGAFAAGDT